MFQYSVRAVLGVGLAAMGILTVAGGTAVADTPVGTCTNSYASTTYQQLAAQDPALTPSLFALIDSNGDGLVCFKPYPNGPHHGHLGNLVDDKAAPHQE